jgi:hypothetical protein
MMMMRSLFYMILCCLVFQATVSGQSVNVKKFGARGDGKTDDAPAINRALKAAHDQKKGVYFPAGTYLCNTVDNSGYILKLDAGGLKGIRLRGDSNATRITTSLNRGSTLLYIWAWAPDHGMVIKNIFFENTHGLINAQTNAIFVAGTHGENFTNVRITGCRFDGFGNAISGQGVIGWTIDHNTFGAPRGHDNAKNDTEPAVYLWFGDNEGGYCRDIKITHNVADGYTGAGPINALVTKRAMDGFVYGTGYGFTITGNITRNFSEEHIALSPKSTIPDDTTQTLIANNHIDATIPAGSMDDNGAKKHLCNYGIRCDISNAVITNNEVLNYTYGIMVRGVEYPQVKIHSYQILGNKLYAAGDTANYDVESGISIQGNWDNRVRDVQLIGNQIHINKLKNFTVNGIVLYDMDKGLIQNNTFAASQQEKVQKTAIYYRRVGQILEKTNDVVGMKFRKIVTPADSVQIITDEPNEKNNE